MWDTQADRLQYHALALRAGRGEGIGGRVPPAGLAFGTYHSVCDWHHPDFPLTSPGGSVRRPTSNLDRYEQYLRAEVSELITHYGPLLVMWFDVPQEFSVERGQGLLDFTRALQPDIIINDRSGAPGDYDTPEQRVGKFQNQRPWETCMTICRQWAWKPDDDDEVAPGVHPDPGAVRGRGRQPALQCGPDARWPHRAAPSPAPPGNGRLAQTLRPNASMGRGAGPGSRPARSPALVVGTASSSTSCVPKAPPSPCRTSPPDRSAPSY